jgi:hypothetical protein
MVVRRKTIGGFFPLFSGLTWRRQRKKVEGMVLNSGRSSLAYILDEVRPARIHLPFYLCGEIHDLLTDRDLEVVPYSIDSFLEPVRLPTLRSGDLFYLVNYFGLKKALVNKLALKFGHQLVVDNTHDLLSEHPPGCWSFTNIRKTVGLPDGAIIVGPCALGHKKLPVARVRLRHLVVRWFGSSQLSLKTFRENESRFGPEVARASWLSRALIANIDTELISRRRVENFLVLKDAFETDNLLDLPLGDCIPFCYPLLVSEDVSRESLAALGLFIPRYWDGIDGIPGISAGEVDLAASLLPLPIDHRYMKEDMIRMVRKLRDLL